MISVEILDVSCFEILLICPDSGSSQVCFPPSDDAGVAAVSGGYED